MARCQYVNSLPLHTMNT